MLAQICQAVFSAIIPLTTAGILVTVPAETDGWEFRSFRTRSEAVYIHAIAFYTIGLLYWNCVFPRDSDKEAGYQPPELVRDELV